MGAPQQDLIWVALLLIAPCGWLSFRAIRTPAASPDRLIFELRLAQFAALVLVFNAGTWVGFSILASLFGQEVGPGTDLRGSMDVALAMGFFAAAATAGLRDPREALTILAVAFALHSLIDMLHRPGYLFEAPLWFVVGCATFDVMLGALCYYPLLNRRA